MNNAEFGMSVQKLICEQYNIIPNEWAQRQYESNYNSEYDKFKDVIPKIFKEIGAYPTVCVSFEKDPSNNNSINPNNFYLSNGMTLSVKTSHSRNSAKVAPNIVGQAGYEKLNYHFGHLCDETIEDQWDIKK